MAHFLEDRPWVTCACDRAVAEHGRCPRVMWQRIQFTWDNHTTSVDEDDRCPGTAPPGACPPPAQRWDTRCPHIATAVIRHPCPHRPQIPWRFWPIVRGRGRCKMLGKMLGELQCRSRQRQRNCITEAGATIECASPDSSASARLASHEGSKCRAECWKSNFVPPFQVTAAGRHVCFFRQCSVTRVAWG